MLRKRKQGHSCQELLMVEMSMTAGYVRYVRYGDGDAMVSFHEEIKRSSRRDRVGYQVCQQEYILVLNMDHPEDHCSIWPSGRAESESHSSIDRVFGYRMAHIRRGQDMKYLEWQMSFTDGSTESTDAEISAGC